MEWIVKWLITVSDRWTDLQRAVGSTWCRWSLGRPIWGNGCRWHCIDAAIPFRPDEYLVSHRKRLLRRSQLSGAELRQWWLAWSMENKPLGWLLPREKRMDSSCRINSLLQFGVDSYFSPECTYVEFANTRPTLPPSLKTPTTHRSRRHWGSDTDWIMNCTGQSRKVTKKSDDFLSLIMVHQI